MLRSALGVAVIVALCLVEANLALVGLLSPPVVLLSLWPKQRTEEADGQLDLVEAAGWWKRTHARVV